MKFYSQKKLSRAFVFLLLINPFAFKVLANNSTNFVNLKKTNHFLNTKNTKIINPLKLISEATLNEDNLLKEVIDAVDNSSGLQKNKQSGSEDINIKLLQSDIKKKLENKEAQLKEDGDNWYKKINTQNIDSFSRRKKNKNVNIEFGDISTGSFKIQPRGYLDIGGPDLTLNLKNADSIETLKLLSKTGGYGFVIIDNNSEISSTSEEEKKENPTITATFSDTKFSHAFNSILMASGLQAKIENKIIYVGKNLLNKSLNSKYSKTYRLNQASAASVADYLTTLGAKISKVLVKGSAVIGDELGNDYVDAADINENLINSYSFEGGPLKGLIGTVDLRLQTITLIGNKNLISNAEKYIKKLDARQKQVALSVTIIDVSLTKSDLIYNRFDAVQGTNWIINNGGLDIMSSNAGLFKQTGGPIDSIDLNSSLTEGKFLSWLSTKIKNENAKIVASPTLVLGENADPILSGAAAVDDELGAATIGRPFANEAFIKVGETVVTNFSVTITDGVTTCTPTNGTSGITFGAKVDKIDDNGYVTFALSPAISSVTSTLAIAGCGTQSTLSVRKLDTGSIRVKNGDTLILTGVLKDEDNITSSKVPLLGDLPLLGRLFRNDDTLKRKSELIILVTPRIIND